MNETRINIPIIVVITLIVAAQLSVVESKYQSKYKTGNNKCNNDGRDVEISCDHSLLPGGLNGSDLCILHTLELYKQ